ncbi:MAG: M15 family metallopeptidase [Bacteroidetes bacterium]|nr:M15 family metallopeptidase [Bacteroidota bacterium]
MIKVGSIGKDVIQWQEFLKLSGYNIGSLDGIFGSKVESATKEWQKKNGLEADGIVGSNTLQKAGLSVVASPSPINSKYYPPKPDFAYPNSTRVRQLFGNFSFRNNKGKIEILDNWAGKNVVKVRIPELIGVYGAPKDGMIEFHKLGENQLKGAFSEIGEKGLADRIISFGGSFYPRFIRGSVTTLSNHSWATALDLNAPENWLGERPASIGEKGSLLELVPIFNKWGFFWGGHYNKRLDGMHFELAKLL